MNGRRSIEFRRGASGAVLAMLLVCGCKLLSVGGNAGRPRLVLETTTRNLGPVLAGESARTDFPVRNDGGATVRIKRIEARCGCVVPSYPTSLPAHSSAEILVRFEPLPSWGGRVEGKMQLHSNDPVRPVQELTVVADVVPFIRMVPAGQLEVPYHPGQIIRKRVEMVPRSGSGLRILEATSDSGLVKATLEPPSKSDPRRAYHLALVIGPCPTAGDFTAGVRLATTESRIPAAGYLVRGLAMEGAVVEPSQVMMASFPAGEAGRELARLKVFTRSGQLRLLGVETGNPNLRVETRTERPGAEYLLILRSAGGWRKGPASAEVRIFTDDPRTPVISVPFEATVT
jgi:hypothetical protein